MFRLHVGLALMAALLLAGGWLMGEDPKKADDPDTPAKVRGALPAGWKSLKLSKEQKAKVYGIQASYTAKIADLQKKIEELRNEEKAEMASVLTAEQKTQLKAILLGETPKPKDDKDKTPDKTPEKPPSKEKADK
jgi:Spy/CpxP family protein refolding chaperone